MRRYWSVWIVLLLIAGVIFSPVSIAAGHEAAPSRILGPQEMQSQTFTVMVGLDNPHIGIMINAYFPETVKIHVGDTVRWVQNSVEFHTVTFLQGAEIPPLLVDGIDPNISPAMLNPVATEPVIPPDGQYDGSSFANSGLMGFDAGEAREFKLTFTAEGVFEYTCLVHGAPMTGWVEVVGPDEPVLSPPKVRAMGRQEMAAKRAQLPAVLMSANATKRPAEMNDDGTTTHYVMMGYSEGQFDIARFFPAQLRVRPGDTVVWVMSPANEAPHTATILNGAASPDFLTLVPQGSGYPLFYINPAVLFPDPLFPPTPILTRSGVYSSGVLPPIPETSYSLVIGDMAPGPEPFVCLLHDESGMTGKLIVLPK